MMFMIVSAVLPVAARAQRVTVDIEGLGSDSLAVDVYPFGSEERQSIAVWAPKGEAVIDLPQGSVVGVAIIPRSLVIQRQGGETWLDSRTIELFVNPGENVKVKGRLEENVLRFEATGSELVRGFARWRDEQLPITLEREKLNMLDRPGAAEEQRSAELREMGRKITYKWIDSDPDAPIAALLVAKMVPLDSIEVYAAKLGEKAKQGVLREMVEAAVKWEQDYKRMQAAREKVVAGADAPRFTLKTPDGGELSLTDIEGKEYIVVDFWGTWCGPCLAGMPKMKEYYEKYRGRVEFVSIDCNEKEDKWREYLSQNELPWLHVIENPEGGGISVDYGVEAFPSKYIIDKEYRIVATFQGEGYDFYIKMDELMK